MNINRHPKLLNLSFYLDGQTVSTLTSCSRLGLLAAGAATAAALKVG